MRQKPTTGHEERIRLALERGPRPMSVRALAKEMGRRFPDLRGTSYGGIRLYTEDSKVTNPRVELLRAIAEVLEVRPDWLAFGAGAPTEEEERARLAAEAGEEPELDYRAEVVRHIKEGFGNGADRLFASRVTDTVVIQTWRRFVERSLGELLFEMKGEAHLGLFIGKALRAPFDAMQVDPVWFTDEAFEEYVLAVCTGLRHLAAGTTTTPPTPEDTND